MKTNFSDGKHNLPIFAQSVYTKRDETKRHTSTYNAHWQRQHVLIGNSFNRKAYILQRVCNKVISLLSGWSVTVIRLKYCLRLEILFSYYTRQYCRWRNTVQWIKCQGQLGYRNDNTEAKT